MNLLRPRAQAASVARRAISQIDERLVEWALLRRLDRVRVAPHWFDELLDRRLAHMQVRDLMGDSDGTR